MRFSTWTGLLVLFVLGVALTACNSITGSGDIDALETKNAQLQSTIVGLGTPALTMAALQQAATQSYIQQLEVSNAKSTATAAELRALSLQATLTVLQGGGSAVVVQPTSLPAPDVASSDQGAQVPVGSPTPAPNSQQTYFSQTVTATGRDADDCAQGVTAVFEATEDTIFVVTRINFLPAGSTFSARWTANGTLFFDDTQCWIPNQDYVNICAYCSIVPDGPTFEAGSWTVDLLLDGQRLAQAQFQVMESSSTAEESMSE